MVTVSTCLGLILGPDSRLLDVEQDWNFWHVQLFLEIFQSTQIHLERSSCSRRSKTQLSNLQGRVGITVSRWCIVIITIFNWISCKNTFHEINKYDDVIGSRVITKLWRNIAQVEQKVAQIVTQSLILLRVSSLGRIGSLNGFTIEVKLLFLNKIVV